MSRVEQWLRQIFGVPAPVTLTERDEGNLRLARQWRARLEERVSILETTVEVLVRRARRDDGDPH